MEIKKMYLFTFFRSFVVFASISIAFYKANGLNYTNIMILQAMYSLLIFLFEIPSGMISDKLGRKKTLVFGTVGFIIAYSFGVFGSSFIAFLFMQFFAAIGQSCYSGTFTSLLYENLEFENKQKESQKVFANMQIVNLISYMLSSICSIFIVKYISLRATYVVTVLCYIITLFISLYLKDSNNNCENNKDVHFKDYLYLFKESIKIMKDNRELKISFLDYIFYGIVASCIFSLQQPLLIHMKFDVSYFGVVNFILTLVTSIFLFNIDKITKLFKDEKSFLKLSVLLTILCAGVNIKGKSIVVFTISFTLFLIIFRTRNVLLKVQINKFIKDSQRATILSIISAIQMIGLVLLQPITGYFADINVILALVFLLGVLIISYFILFFIANNIKTNISNKYQV